MADVFIYKEKDGFCIECVDSYSKELIEMSSRLLYNLIVKKYKDRLVYACIGSSLVIGDAFGPICGSKLAYKYHKSDRVYGTCDNSLNATNLDEKYIEIHKRGNYVIAIDAALSDATEDRLVFRYGGLKPGIAFKKKIKTIGDLSILYCYNSSVETFEDLERVNNEKVRATAIFVAEVLDKVEKMLKG